MESNKSLWVQSHHSRQEDVHSLRIEVVRNRYAIMLTVNDLFSLIRADAEELRIEFEKASIQGRGTSQDIATFREIALQSVVSNYFPFPFRVAKDGILDSTGRRSASVDCVLINPAHPYTIDRRENFKLIFAEGVHAAIEGKPDISQKSELYRGLEQSVTVKSLRRAETPLILPDEESSEVVEHSLRVPFFIFAMKAKANIIDTALEVLEFYDEQNVDPLDQADAIVVNGEGIIANFPIAEYCWWDRPDWPKSGWFFEHWQDDALAGFLMKLNSVVPPIPDMTPSILTHYLHPAETGVAPIDYPSIMEEG